MRLAFVRWISWILVVGACEAEAEAPRAVWPPVDGELCGDALDLCGQDGTVWHCGIRPLWERVDCTAQCSNQGLEPIGCVLSEPVDRAESARLDGYSGVERGVPSALCLCRQPEDVRCAGIAHRTCASRTHIWTCDRSLEWSRESCADKCAALSPSLALRGCQHSASQDPQEVRTDECVCTIIGAPCQREGEWACSGDDQWIQCVGGIWQAMNNCGIVVCSDGFGATCDRVLDGGACLCGERSP